MKSHFISKCVYTHASYLMMGITSFHHGKITPVATNSPEEEINPFGCLFFGSLLLANIYYYLNTIREPEDILKIIPVSIVAALATGITIFVDNLSTQLALQHNPNVSESNFLLPYRPSPNETWQIRSGDFLGITFSLIFPALAISYVLNGASNSIHNFALLSKK